MTPRCCPIFMSKWAIRRSAATWRRPETVIDLRRTLNAHLARPIGPNFARAALLRGTLRISRTLNEFDAGSRA
jgi:hypothetical protein